MDVLGSPPDPIRRAVTRGFDGAVTGGAVAPSLLAIDDESGSWTVPMASFPISRRSRSILVTGSEASLMTAIRLSVGGAVWLPCSSLAALEALAAAAPEQDCPEPSEAAVFDLAACSGRVSVLHPSEPEFWLRQIGRRGLLRVLAELADRLEVPDACLAWPALLVAGELDEDSLRNAWQHVIGNRKQPMPDLLVLMDIGCDGGASVIYGALCDGAGHRRLASASRAAPVRELPGGRRVGSWWLESQPPQGDGWAAWPETGVSSHGRWRVSGPGVDGTAQEVTTSLEITDVSDAVAVRVPGWATAGLGAGTPSGLVIARLADAAARRGLPLWIPNLEQDGLRFVLGLPGRIWVDGNAVPE